MWKHLRGPLRLAGVVLVAATCTEPQRDPLGGFQGTYVLQSISGQPMPTLELSASTFRVLRVADTITADGRGHYTRRDVEEIDSLSGPNQETLSSSDSGQYVVRGDTVEFPSPCAVDTPCLALKACPLGAPCLVLRNCPMGALCVPLMTFGVLETGGYLMLANGMSASYEWRYKRVR